MILPKLACGLCMLRFGGPVTLAVIGFGAAGLGAAYLMRSRMKHSTGWAEENRKPVPEVPADSA